MNPQHPTAADLEGPRLPIYVPSQPAQAADDVVWEVILTRRIKGIRAPSEPSEVT